MQTHGSFFSLEKLFCFMCIGVLVNMYVCDPCKSGVRRTKKRALNTPEQQLPVVVSSHLDAEN